MSPEISSVWEQTARREWKPYAALTALSCAVLALACAMRLWWSWDFQYSNVNDVRGWVWANQYPKHQETTLYLLAMAAVAAGALASRPLWAALAEALQRTFRTDAVSALRASALTLSAAIVASPLLAGPAWRVVAPLWLPVATVAALALVNGLGSLPAPRGRSSSSFWRILILATAAPVAIYVWHYDGRSVIGLLNLFEDGAMLAPLQASLSGGVVYRDGHIQHGLFHNLGKPLLASLFEVSLTSFRVVDAFLRPFAYVSLYVLGLAVFRSAWTALALSLIFCGAGLQISDRQSFGLLAIALIAFALRSEEKASTSQRLFRVYFAASGMCTTLAFFYSTEIGLYSAAACGGFTVVRAILDRHDSVGARLAPLVAYCAGLVLSSVPFLGYFLWQGALFDFVENTYVQCVYQAAAWGRPFDSLADATGRWPGLTKFAGSRTFRAYLAPTVYAALVGVVSFRLTRPGFWKSASSQTVLLLVLAAVVWFRTTLGRFDPRHVAEGTPFVWMIVFLHAEHVLVTAAGAITSSSHRLRGAVVVAAGALLISSEGWVLHRAHDIPSTIARRASMVASGSRRQPDLGPPFDRLGPIERPEQMVEDLRAVVRRIRELTKADDFIFDFTNQGALYFLSDRRSPSRYQQIVYSATQEMDRELVKAIDQKKPRVVVFESAGPIATYLSKIDGVPITTRHPLVAEYLAQHYRFAEEVGGTKLHVRKDAVPVM